LRERPAVTVAAKLVAARGRVTDLRLAVGGTSGAPVLASEAAHRLIAERASELGESALAEVTDTAAAEVEPAADLDGSAEFKRQLVRVLTERCLRELLEAVR
jgi:carbon-monoxide dehydrogenase medium subunit